MIVADFRIKKFFGEFTLTPSHFPLKAPVYRRFDGEGKCEGKCEGKNGYRKEEVLCNKWL